MARSSGNRSRTRRPFLTNGPPLLCSACCTAAPPAPQIILASTLSGLVALAQLVVQPGPCESPVAIRGSAGDAQGGSGIFQRQPGEETEFDQLGTERVLPGQLLECLVEGGEVVGRFGHGKIDLIEAEASPIAAPLEPALVAGAV